MARRIARGLQRNPARREPKRRFIVFCEGNNTEPAYLKAVRRIYLDSLIAVEIVPGGGVPYTIAQTAAKRARDLGLSSRRRKSLNSYEQNDQVWAMFDRDEHPRYGDAIALCQARGVRIARSNPCFEVWLVLHEADYDRPDGRYAVQQCLRSLRPEYDPRARKVANCTELVAHISEAESRAEAQLLRREVEGAPFGPPSTTVFLLTRAIRDAALLAR